jgi:hypothetical protein
MNPAEIHTDLFPIHVVHLDNTDLDDEYYDTLEMLGQELEFYDEFTPWRIQARSADGAPLRVISFALEIVLCRRTRYFATRNELSVMPCVGQNDSTGEAELCAGETHRILWADGSVEPSEALGMPSDVTLLAGKASDSRRFNEAWLRRRCRR